jgi:glycosyltransferase involved in cell wall biosynthesis
VPLLTASFRTNYRYSLGAYMADGFLLRSAKRQGAEVLARIGEFEPHILHFHTLPRNLGLGILAARRARRTHAELVFTDHVLRIRGTDYSPQARFVLRMAYRRLYRHYHVISVGRAVDASNRTPGFLSPAKRHILLENQIDIEYFRPPPQPRTEEPVGLVAVGRIHVNKGLHTLIRAFAGLDPAVRADLTVVGPDEMDGAMHDLAAKVVPEGRQVRFVGARSDVRELLHAASVGVFPSSREGLPLALLEMMATGLPVVVSDIPALQAIITDDVDGLVVPLDDVEALTRALTSLIQDRARRERLGAAARAGIERHHREDPIQALEAFYQSVAHSG